MLFDRSSVFEKLANSRHGRLGLKPKNCSDVGGADANLSAEVLSSELAALVATVQIRRTTSIVNPAVDQRKRLNGGENLARPSVVDRFTINLYRAGRQSMTSSALLDIRCHVQFGDSTHHANVHQVSAITPQ